MVQPSSPRPVKPLLVAISYRPHLVQTPPPVLAPVTSSLTGERLERVAGIKEDLYREGRRRVDKTPVQVRFPVLPNGHGRGGFGFGSLMLRPPPKKIRSLVALRPEPSTVDRPMAL